MLCLSTPLGSLATTQGWGRHGCHDLPPFLPSHLHVRPAPLVGSLFMWLACCCPAFVVAGGVACLFIPQGFCGGLIVSLTAEWVALGGGRSEWTGPTLHSAGTVRVGCHRARCSLSCCTTWQGKGHCCGGSAPDGRAARVLLLLPFLVCVCVYASRSLLTVMSQRAGGTCMRLAVQSTAGRWWCMWGKRPSPGLGPYP